MYYKDGVAYRLITIELNMPEPVFVGKKLYQDIANRLIAHKVSTSEPIVNEIPGDDDTITNLIVHVSNPDNPENVRLVHVKKALEGLLDNYPVYAGIKISIN